MGTVSYLADSKVLCTWEYNDRNQNVTKITPHCMVAKWTGKQCATYFRDNGIENSANYCIGYNGDICCNVEEEHRAWTSSSYSNDMKAITVEIANTDLNTLAMSDASIEAFKKLAVDIALRYGIKKYTYTGDDRGNFTLHRFFAGTSCPGDWFVKRIPEIITDINERIKNGSPEKAPIDLPKAPFIAKVLIDDLNVRKKASLSSAGKGYIGKGCYRITSTKDGFGWVKGKGYIYLGNTSYAKTYALPFKAQVLIDDLNVRKSATTTSKVIGTAKKATYEITNVQNNWGYSKALNGWIYISEDAWVKIKK